MTIRLILMIQMSIFECKSKHEILVTELVAAYNSDFFANLSWFDACKGERLSWKAIIITLVRLALSHLSPIIIFIQVAVFLNHHMYLHVNITQ